MIFQIIGGLLILFGVVDLGGSYADFDLWGTMGIELPEFLWSISAYIELAVGYGLFKLGSGFGSDEEEFESKPAKVTR